MKRIVIAIVCNLLMLGATAQYSDLYYHREGDTISNGYFMWWDFEEYYDNDMAVLPGGGIMTFGLLQYAERYYTATTLKIIGVAASVSAYDNVINQATTSLEDDDWFFIYTPEGGNMVERARVKWFSSTKKRTLRIKRREGGGVSDCCNATVPKVSYFPMYEFYFDSAIYVKDTFYVASSFYSDTLRYDKNGFMNSSKYETNINRVTFKGSSDVVCDCGISCKPVIVSKLATGNNHGVWSTDNEHSQSMFLMYPVIQVDTTVPPPSYCPAELTNFQAVATAAGCMTATWDGFPNYSEVQLVHGPITVAQADWDTAVVAGANIFTVCGIDTAEVSLYGFKARAICAQSGDTTGWVPLQWYSTEVEVGIEEVEAVGHTRLVPNPAQGSVSVRSQHSLLHLDIYNARGILVYSERITGHDAQVSLEGLPAGLYLASITTTHGTTVRRLLVR